MHAGRIAYDPPLPAGHSHLMAGMVHGAIIRGLAVYDRPFWRDDGLTGQATIMGAPVPVTIDQTPASGSPGVLSSYAFGPGALQMARLSPAERRAEWLGILAQAFGPRARNPELYHETDWSAEEWSLGGMIAHFAPGVLTSYGPALRASVGRIHWAGSERATEMHGLIEGAVRSGELTAAAVLRVLGDS
jgi:monoamine oxidase